MVNGRIAGQPTLITDRLVLRPFELADGPAVRLLAGHQAIADTTLHIPHPYEEGMAESWIATHQERFENGAGAIFAICLKPDGPLIGAIGLDIEGAHSRAELGYWIGKPYWNRGYCTEAAGAVIAYAFDTLRLNRVQARHFRRNPASGRVMQKIGMIREGCLRQSVQKWGVFEDLEIYSILREEYDGRSGEQPPF